MPNKPEIRYFLYHSENPVRENDDAWKTPIPMNRNDSQNEGNLSISHGEYFHCIRSFLEKDGFERIASAVSRETGQGPEKIETINIYSEKHGEFYHPARIETGVHGSEVSSVLNMAVSEAGKACIRREYDLLKQLDNAPCSFLPRVYGQGTAYIKDGLEARMFLGEWFKGYHEFHISQDQTDKNHKIVVWDPEKGHFFLTPDQTAELYTQAAMILTAYYNAETFEQIWPWHHAAGDFVIRCHNNGIGLKLITVRQYQALLNNKDRDANSILDALLMFLVNLSVRMRLDRFDGTGDIVWADEIAVLGTLNGFFQALESKTSPLLPAPISDCFRYYLSQITETDLYEWGEAVLGAYHPMAPEVPVIQKYMEQHTAILHHYIQQVC